MDVMKSQSEIAEHAERVRSLPFLRKKFEPPRPKGQHALVPEERITPLVMDLDTWDICLVTSPAGTGKTALLSQWYSAFSQRQECEVFWISLDANDASPLRFTQALVEAFSAYDPRFTEEASSLQDPSDTEALAITLVNCADVGFADIEYVVVFLDGYERAVSPELDEMIAFFNRYLADNVHLVVAGTYIPSALSDLAMECDVLEFGVQDTRWDERRLGARLFWIRQAPNYATCSWRRGIRHRDLRIWRARISSLPQHPSQTLGSLHLSCVHTCVTCCYRGSCPGSRSSP